MYKNLNHYIDKLEQEGELRRITEHVDPIYQIAEITDRESKRKGGGKALLFENTGTQFPVITNMMGSDSRISMALGVESLDDIHKDIDSLFKSVFAPKKTFMDRLKMLPLLSKANNWLPKESSFRGECQKNVMKDPSFNALPILKCWPFDGGRFVTLPLVHTVDPDTGVRNVGMYRMQIFDSKSCGMHWHLHKTGERHYRTYKEKGLRMPVAICLGGDPVYTYSATAPLPDGIDEYILAGFLRNKRVELCKCLTSDLRVPSDCDFVIEGYVDTTEDKVVEGPFGDHTGFYSLPDMYPKFHLTAITYRNNAVYPATVVGIPPQEDVYISKATEKIFLSPIKNVMQSEVRDLYMPVEGVSHNIAVVNIKNDYAGQPFKVSSALWGAGQMMFNKFMFITDTDKNIRKPEVIAELMQNISFKDDILISKGPLDVLDHAASEVGFGGKMAIDLTKCESRKNDGKDHEIITSIDIVPTEGALFYDLSYIEPWQTIVLGCKDYAKSDSEEITNKFIKENNVSGVKFIVLFDHNVPLDDPSVLLWLGASNCDPSRDIKIESEIMIIDARAKFGDKERFSRAWPNVVVSSRETIEEVDRMWNHQFGDFVESPSNKYSELLLSDDVSL